VVVIVLAGGVGVAVQFGGGPCSIAKGARGDISSPSILRCGAHSDIVNWIGEQKIWIIIVVPRIVCIYLSKSRRVAYANC